MEGVKVERKEEITKLNPKTHEIETWFRMWATSKGGTYFHVDVPESALDKAGETLNQKATQIDAIK